MLNINYIDNGQHHKDLVLRIDELPTYHSIADTYYLSDFMESKAELPFNSVVKEFLEYWKTRIEDIKHNAVFIPFDLSDEYVGGIVIKPNEVGYTVNPCHSKELNGWGTNIDTISKLDIGKEGLFIYDDKNEFLTTKESLLQGINRSIDKLAGK
jgi:hypothetical protein